MCSKWFCNAGAEPIADSTKGLRATSSGGHEPLQTPYPIRVGRSKDPPPPPEQTIREVDAVGAIEAFSLLMKLSGSAR
jgi:hypothetical protein